VAGAVKPLTPLLLAAVAVFGSEGDAPLFPGVPGDGLRVVAEELPEMFKFFEGHAAGQAEWRLPGWRRRRALRLPESAGSLPRLEIPPGIRAGEIRIVDAASGRLLPHWIEYMQVRERRAVAEGEDIHYGFPRLVRAGNGDLLLFYRVGTTHVYDYSSIAQRTSADGGRTWSAERIIHRDPRQDHSATNTVALVTPSGRVVNWLASFGFEANPRTRDTTYWRWSDDHGRTWSGAEIFDSNTGRSTYYVTDAIRTTDGMLAAAATFPPGGVGNCWTVIWHSTDSRSWTVRSHLTSPEENLGDETALMETAPGEIVCLLRTRRQSGADYPKGLLRFWSKDGGRTWTPPENLYAMLGCTLQRPFLTRLDNQTLLLTGRDYERKQVVAYLSTDNARSFGRRHVLDSYVQDGGYTTAVTVGERTVLVAYYTDIDSAPLKPDIKLVLLEALPEAGCLRIRLLEGQPGGSVCVYYDNPGAEPREERAEARIWPEVNVARPEWGAEEHQPTQPGN